MYEGDWVHGIREGQGKLTFKDGSYYRGDFVKNQMWGHGIFVGKCMLSSPCLQSRAQVSHLPAAVCVVIRYRERQHAVRRRVAREHAPGHRHGPIRGRRVSRLLSVWHPMPRTGLSVPCPDCTACAAFTTASSGAT